MLVIDRQLRKKPMSLHTDNPPPVQSAIIRAVGEPIDARRSLTKLSVVFAQVAAIEFLLVAASTYIATTLYHYPSAEGLPFQKEYVGGALFIAALFTIVSLGFRHFNMAQRRQLHVLLWSGIGAVALAFAFFLSTAFLLKISSDYSRGAFIFQIITVSVAVCIFRGLLAIWLQSAVTSGIIEPRRAVLIGDIDSKIIAELRSEGVRVVHSTPLPYNNEFGDAAGDRKVSSYTNVRKIIDLCRTLRPDDVVILAGQTDLAMASGLAHYFSELPCNIHIAPVGEIRFLTRSQIAELGNVKTLQVSRRPLSFAELAIKRSFDIVIATIALIGLSPLLTIVALAIRLDSRGNVIFRQMRHGYNNEIIRVFKFRTMRMADDNDRGNFVATTENDGRITILGQILRRTSIDELPQLVNVMLGEMSIVGPRPHATSHNKMFEDQILPFARRHNVKPGITGWAQVNGYRGPANTIDKMQLRVEYDLFYIDNWSLFFDLKIILMTLFSKKVYNNAF